MSITDHPLWPELLRYLKVQEYRRDGGTGNCRFRLEFRHMPESLVSRAQAITVHCVSCGRPIHPIRLRQPSARGKTGNLYYACACPLEVSVGCSRGSAAKAEYLHVRAAVDTGGATQSTLF